VEPDRIYLIGFMGAGKTAIGRLLASKLGWKFIDLDEEIERREGRAVAEIFRREGESHFRTLERLCLKDFSSSPETVIALGGGAFVDPENRNITETTGISVWLKVPFSKLVERVKIDGTRPKFTDRAQAERLYEMREPLYALAKIQISTEHGTPESAADEIIGELKRL
jgi:shikimate kinase